MKTERKDLSRKTNVKSSLNLLAMQNDQFVSTREAMIILGIKSQTTIGKYETEGKIKAYRPFSNRKRYKVSELLKLQSKR
ncbi:hypothetical protein [Flavobacterium sp. 245]|uniref:hypothetical protein n=1 Tax=Flavobacterium sp. 245 TaxID=2512115 RepID=UPI00105F4489|nr:hypothetical protein [Flavobacterium sp. 245]TDP02476.1 hypothetical protein EV145_103466 [Flavobacterium sp. 245]